MVHAHPAGILKSFVGLSGSVFTTVYIGAFKPHVLTFLRFLSIGPPLLGLAALLFVNHVPLDAKDTTRGKVIAEADPAVSGEDPAV